MRMGMGHAMVSVTKASSVTLYLYLFTAMVSLPATSVTATSELQQLSTPLYPLPYIGNMELEYTITTEGNNVVTLEVRI